MSTLRDPAPPTDAGIVVVGSLALDTVRTPFGAAENVLGGSAAYFALAARLFTPVTLVAVVGKDFPARDLDRLRQPGINLDHVEVADGESFRWGGEYGYDLNSRETLFTHLNVFEHFRPRLPEELKTARHLFLANIDPDLQRDVLGQVQDPELVVCDTMNFWITGKRESLKEALRDVDVVILNDGEARQLAEEPNLWKAGRAILDLGPAVVVIKKGEHGAMLLSREESFTAPSYPVEMVYDPTGAGDSFAGGFMGYLVANGRHDPGALRRAVIYGSAAASFCVERFSVEALVGLSRADLERRGRELKLISHFDLD